MLENSCRKSCGPFQTHVGSKNPRTGVKKILPYMHQRQKSQFLREGKMQRALGRVDSAFPGMLEQRKELP
jgi:hypothetical protein